MNRNLYGNVARRRPRTFRLKEFVTNNIFSDKEIRNCFRFSRENIAYLVDLLREDLQRPTQRSYALSVETQVLIARKFFACNSYQQVVGDVIGVEKSQGLSQDFARL